MKANRNKAILRVILAVMLCLPMLVAIRLSANSEGEAPSIEWDSHSYTNTSYLTPGGQRVDCRSYTSDLTETQKRKLIATDMLFINNGHTDTITQLAQPTLRYNCYSYAFYSRNAATNTYYIDHTTGDINTEGQPLYAYWQDAHFSNAPRDRDEACAVGDVVLYYSSKNTMTLCHAAVVSEVDSQGDIIKVMG